MKPLEYTEEMKEQLAKSFQLDFSHCRELPCNPVYYYTDLDNDEIRYYVFEAEKVVPDILENPTVLEPIDLIDLAQELQKVDR
ncbi:MAG TPA: hypothetical protein VI423_10910 [Paenisporosarcina sp.]|nr:hypothetical protein [Paenisporosarcina sp.]